MSEEKTITPEDLKNILTGNEEFTRYREDLKFLADKAHAEYMLFESYTLPNQNGLIKTYLWIASVLFTVEMTLLLKLTENNYALLKTFYQNQNLYPPTLFYYFYFASLCCAVGTFLFAIDTLRGRDLKENPFRDFKSDLVTAFEDTYENNQVELYVQSIERLDDALSQRMEMCSIKGRKLRKMSKLLVYGFINCLISIIILSFPAINFTYTNLLLSAVLLPIPICLILYYLID